MAKKTVRDIPVKGKRVLIRVDYNVPQDKAGNITDDARIVKTLPTLQYLIGQGAKVILMSHLGRPKKVQPEFSLAPVAKKLSELLKKPVPLAEDCVGPKVRERVGAMKDGDVLLLENLRFHPEEEKNDPEFSKQLAASGDVYVDDAFGAAHRAHASIEGVTHYLPVAVSGFLLEKEIVYLGKALSAPDRPFFTILGGAKVSDKIEVINNLMDKVNGIIIGGGMAYTFLKARGEEIGSSKFEAAGEPVAKDILAKAQKAGVKIILPCDHVIADAFAENANHKVSDTIPAGWMGLDIGPKTIELFKKELASAKTIVWNGPLGVFEWEAFAKGSIEIAKFISTLGATTIIGGGDTASAIKQFGLEDKMSHVSTGGGASLEFLEGKTLPGIACIQDK
ncbi:MAG TPA: phosphoglycerate kinase [Candidatus Omnitrophota bacterium]|nr:phosphoglycerate kinase [Candidatus Omnitrophota bacterium]